MLAFVLAGADSAGASAATREASEAARGASPAVVLLTILVLAIGVWWWLRRTKAARDPRLDDLKRR